MRADRYTTRVKPGFSLPQKQVTMKFKLWMLVIMVLCVSLWLVTRHGIPSEYNEISKHPFSHGYVPESNRVDDTSVKLGIQCVGAGPIEAEDLFCMERPQYLPDFKNPCWFAKEDGKLRLKCVPYFHLLGVCKSGTTDLAYRIRAHEDVLECNDCRGKKECFYWCRRRYGYEWSMKERTPCNFSCFQHMFADAAQKIEQTTTETGYHNMITGDATPSDFSDFRGWPKIPQNVGSEKPVVMTPHLMRHVYTDPKFILIFRNPTERLYSDYTMRGGRSAVAFHEAVRRDIQTEETCMKNHTVEHCLYSLEIARTLRTRIFLGCYSVYMREWLKVFPRNQFLILRTEDHDEDPKSQLRKVYNYLKLNYTEDWLSFIANVPHQHVSQKKIRQGPMLEKTRVLLDNFYSRYKQDLSNILQDKRFLWVT
ncbi:carbohydrate sulfotransferase 15-like isoform X1 [Haliotis rufescens]|uniref:carbohydrate sulfotransferase 15-like isoform X1 n=2 Tax=Haliotis rufescens TaxID=6454 RepID=UPI00201F09FE|nr:carbohydrate sulfotransferase 15-like isoform X1 [Haliotis rufescens]